ncbi:8836_t:CDS:2 [Diversispora eburnea]|uniref:8836_t:CDS:1 n=1 Tax=Diversispora eburnea TaxID=1213867 RepID=A0A9N9BSG3_9GLOM|nr:8836_t:CDS:2 [Diversispora eburnea]
MSSDNTLPSTTSEATLPGNSTSSIDDDTLLTEITEYFVDRGFQPSLGSEGVKLGEDKELFMKWGLTEEATNELRDSVRDDDDVWSQRGLKHWLLDWIYNPWGSFTQISFDKIFYDPQFQRNQWHSYERKGGPQIFVSSYEDIVTIGEDALLRCNTKVSNPMNSNFKACRPRLDFGYLQSFYLNPPFDNAVSVVKNNEGYNGIVIYWVDMERVKSIKYRDLIPDKNLWREVVVSSRCEQYSVVDDDDFVNGHQLSNPRQILSAWRTYGGADVEDSRRNLISMTRWFEPIRHLQLAVKTNKAIKWVVKKNFSEKVFKTDRFGGVYPISRYRSSIYFINPDQ